MERYESYKDSGVKWLGEIPSHWEVRKAKYIWKEKEDVSTNGRETLLSVSQYNGVVPNTEASRSESLIGYKIVENNNLVINIMLAWMGGLGVSRHFGIVSPAYCVYKTITKCDTHFLHYLYKTPLYLSEFARRSSGIVPSRWRMYTDDFGQVQTLLPPISEQTAIANYLDSVTSKIDEAISQQQQMIDLLNERKQIIIQNAVTKGLDPNVKMKDSGVEWIGEIPEDWVKITMKRIFRERVAGSWGEDENKGSQNTFCLRIADFDYSKLKFIDKQQYTIRSYTKKEIERKKLKIGDLLIEKSGGGEKTPVGRVVMFDLCLKNAMYANFMEKLCVREITIPEYVNYLLSAFYANGMVWPYIKATTGIQNFDITNFLSKEFVFIPNLTTQNEIVYYLKNRTSKIDDFIIKCNKQISLLQERKQIIINDVVTGKIKVI